MTPVIPYSLNQYINSKICNIYLYTSETIYTEHSLFPVAPIAAKGGNKLSSNNILKTLGPVTFYHWFKIFFSFFYDATLLVAEVTK